MQKFRLSSLALSAVVTLTFGGALAYAEGSAEFTADIMQCQISHKANLNAIKVIGGDNADVLKRLSVELELFDAYIVKLSDAQRASGQVSVEARQAAYREKLAGMSIMERAVASAKTKLPCDERVSDLKMGKN